MPSPNGYLGTRDLSLTVTSALSDAGPVLVKINPLRRAAGPQPEGCPWTPPWGEMCEKWARAAWVSWVTWLWARGRRYHPEQLAEMRAPCCTPSCWVPGYGAQGRRRAKDVIGAFDEKGPVPSSTLPWFSPPGEAEPSRQ